jgi:hypothetical protein
VYLSPALGLLAVVSAAVATATGPDEGARPAARPAVRVYTNVDLERIHPFAGQTGGSSVPGAADPSPEGEREPASGGRGEAYWRREAAAVLERLRTLDERAAALRARIAERERAPREETVYGRRGRSSSGSGSASGSVASLRSSLAALERRMQRTQEDLEDRARRDGALPGWLR